MVESALVEKLAALAHEQWSGWMKYLFGLGEENPDGSFTISKDKVDRWKRQMRTDYADLPDGERESDRIEARKVLEVLDVDPSADQIRGVHSIPDGLDEISLLGGSVGYTYNPDTREYEVGEQGT